MTQLRGKPVTDAMAERLRAQAVPVKTGIFGADMRIGQLNDGPVTILFEI